MDPTCRSSVVSLTILLGAALVAGCATDAGDATAATASPTDGATATTSPPADDAVTLVLANPLMDMPEQLIDWAVEVRDATDERVQFDVRSSFGAANGYADAEQAVLDAVQSGEADVGWVGARALPPFDPMLAPMLVDSHDLQEALFEAGVPQRLLEDVELPGLTGVGVLPGPMRRMLGVDRDFRAPADFAGATIMSDLAGPAPETMEALGAEELVAGAEGLDISGLDGIQAHVGAVVGNSYQSVAQSFTSNFNLWPRPLVVVANDEVLAALSAEHRAALLNAAERAFPTVMETAREEDLLPETQHADLCTSALELIELSPDELDALREAVRPVHDRIAGDGGWTYLEEIAGIKAELGSQPDVFRC